MQTRLRSLALAASLVAFAPGCGDSPVDEGMLIQRVTTSYRGVVSSQAFVNAPTSSGGTSKLYVVGMKVELMAKDFIDDIVLAEDFTSEGGNFSLQFEHDSDKEELELYLRFTSETEGGTIRVRQRFLGVKSSRKEDVMRDAPIVVSATSPEVNSALPEIQLDATNTKPHLLHWANRARTFTTTELGNRSPLPDDPDDPLDILVPPLGFNGQNSPNFFVPDTLMQEIVDLITFGVIVALIPVGTTVAVYVEAEFSDQDAIYIAEASEFDTTVFHEFGHYLLWHAQGNRWLNPLEASFSSHSSIANAGNTKIAWTEGFANGFENIVNQWSSTDDGVGTRDFDTTGPEIPGINGTPSCAGGGPTCNDQGVSHGFFSEFYIGEVLYDLWDGPTNYNSGPNNGAATSLEDYSDCIDPLSCVPVEEVELTFKEIMDPILDTRNRPQSSLVKGIPDYYRRLFNRHSERAIKDLFSYNKLRNLHTDAAADYLLFDLLNSDDIFASRDIEVELYNFDNGTLISSSGSQTELHDIDVTRLVGSNDDYNLASKSASDTTATLHDDLVVAGTSPLGLATLSFNQSGTVGWQSALNAYDASVSPQVAVASHFDVTLAADTHLTAIDRGRIVVGEPATGQTATLTVASGATLTLGGGPGGAWPQREWLPNGPMVSKGRLVIHDGSKVVIEAGATLEFEKGGEIVLDGPDAELIIRGNLVIRAGATFQWSATGGAMVTFDLPNVAGAPNVVMDPGAKFRVNELPFKVLDNTYIRPLPGLANEIILENAARGLFGVGAYIHGGVASVTLTDSFIEALDGKGHLGIVLEGNAHQIDGMDIREGARCLLESRAAGTPLLVTNSTFTGCGVGIEARNRGVGLTTVTISGGNPALLTTNNPDVGVTNSVITGSAVGWRLDKHGTGTFGLTGSTIQGNGTGVVVEAAALFGTGNVIVNDSEILANGIGLQSNGERVRFENNSEVRGNAAGIRMVGGTAVLTARDTEFRGNTTSIALDGAGKPVLNGANAFYPRTTFSPGTALSGTIADTAPCAVPVTITVTSDVWFIWAAAWVVQSMTTAPYSVSTTAGCAVTLVN